MSKAVSGLGTFGGVESKGSRPTKAVQTFGVKSKGSEEEHNPLLGGLSYFGTRAPRVLFRTKSFLGQRTILAVASSNLLGRMGRRPPPREVTQIGVPFKPVSETCDLFE